MAGARDGTLKLWDVRTAGMTLITALSSPVCKATITADGHAALCAVADGSVVVSDLRTGRVLRKFDKITRSGMFASFHYDSNSNTMFAVEPTQQTAVVWQLDRSAPTALLALPHMETDAPPLFTSVWGNLSAGVAASIADNDLSLFYP